MRDSNAFKPVLGIAWYHEEQWPFLLQISADADRLEKTYAQWVQFAEARYNELVQQNKPAEKIMIDVKDLLIWCGEMGRPVDGETRAAYVTYLLHHRRPSIPPASPSKP